MISQGWALGWRLQFAARPAEPLHWGRSNARARAPPRPCRAGLAASGDRGARRHTSLRARSGAALHHNRHIMRSHAMGAGSSHLPELKGSPANALAAGRQALSTMSTAPHTSGVGYGETSARGDACARRDAPRSPAPSARRHGCCRCVCSTPAPTSPRLPHPQPHQQRQQPAGHGGRRRQRRRERRRERHVRAVSVRAGRGPRVAGRRRRRGRWARAWRNL